LRREISTEIPRPAPYPGLEVTQLTKTNKIRSVLAILAVGCGVGLPLVSAAASGCFNKPVPFTFETEAHAAPAPERAVSLPEQIVMPEVVVHGQARGNAPPVSRKAHTKPKPKPEPVCHLQVLEQGGGPSAPFVLVCG